MICYVALAAWLAVSSLAQGSVPDTKTLPISATTQSNLSISSTVTTTTSTPPFANKTSALANSTAAVPFSANSTFYCATTTIYATTLTWIAHYEATTCSGFSNRTVLPTTTIYTGLLTLPSPTTETLLRYGDLYTSGELGSTPTCQPAGCSGTSTTTISATQSTIVTSGTQTVGTICPTTLYNHSTISTTQDIRCAPTNLISAVDGHGIYQPTAVAGASTYTTSTKPVDISACCQQCLDTPDCAAGWSLSELVSQGGAVDTCALVITSTGGGIALNYSDSAPYYWSLLDPDTGFDSNGGVYRVSYGSGSVQPIVYADNCLPPS